MAENTDKRISEIYDAFDKMEKPTGDENIVIPKYENGENKGEYISNFDHRQFVLLGQLMSKDAFPNGDFRYAMLPVQRSYDLVTSWNKEDYELMKRYTNTKSSSPWLKWNREVIFPDAIMPDPSVNGHLEYQGNKIKAKIHNDDILETLNEAGFFKEKIGMPYTPIRFSVDQSAVGSYCHCGNWDMFQITTEKPSYKYSSLAAFEKVPKVAQAEYDQLMQMRKVPGAEAAQNFRESVKI